MSSWTWRAGLASLAIVAATAYAVGQMGPGHPQHPMSGPMHHPMMHGGQFGASGQPTMPGQDAFGTIQEVVRILEDDPSTDWSKVNISALREHLIDMNEVTLRAAAISVPLANGVEIAITGEGRTVVAIKRMVQAHVGQLAELGWSATTEELQRHQAHRYKQRSRAGDKAQGARLHGHHGARRPSSAAPPHDGEGRIRHALTAAGRQKKETLMKTRKNLLVLGAAALLAAGVGTYAFTASSEEGEFGFGPRSMHRMGHGMMGMGHSMMGPGMMGRGMTGAGHGSSAMKDMSAIHELAAMHERIKRTVTNLPNGIRTVTESDDPRIAQLIRDHVASMGKRVRAGKMLNVPIESPAVHAIYANKDKISTTSEPTGQGVVVTQTSSDPKVIALLQEHAVEVSELVRGGMAAMHTAMMKNHRMGGGRMYGPMMGGMDGRMPHGMRHEGR